jgi:hypothetical protein
MLKLKSEHVQECIHPLQPFPPLLMLVYIHIYQVHTHTYACTCTHTHSHHFQKNATTSIVSNIHVKIHPHFQLVMCDTIVQHNLFIDLQN